MPARSLTQADYRACLDVLEDDRAGWSPFVRLAVRLVVVTGLRRREVAGLQWSEVRGDHLLIARHKMARSAGPKRIVLSAAARDVLVLAAARSSHQSARALVPSGSNFARP